MEVKVATPEPSVPVVDKFSSPKEIAPPLSVMLPSANVKVPIVEPVANVATPAPNVPVVVKFSSPKYMLPPKALIVRSPVAPVAKVE